MSLPTQHQCIYMCNYGQARKWNTNIHLGNVLVALVLAVGVQNLVVSLPQIPPSEGLKKTPHMIPFAIDRTAQKMAPN